MSSRTIAPLRTVTDITVTERRGEEIGPHQFWLAREYVSTLECGHTQVRVGVPFHGQQPEEMMPKRMRCAQCPPKTLASRAPAPASLPKHDPVLGLLAQRLILVSPEREEEWLSWVNQKGLWIEDEATRHRVHGAVLLALMEHFAAQVGNEKAPEVLEAMRAWAAGPTTETAEVLRKATRRLYRAQRRSANWFAARGMVATSASATGGMTQSVKASMTRRTEDLDYALSWSSRRIVALYDSLRRSRQALDEARDRDQQALAGMLFDGLEESKQRALDAGVDLERAWADIEAGRQSPDVDPTLLPLLEAMCSGADGVLAEG